MLLAGHQYRLHRPGVQGFRHRDRRVLLYSAHTRLCLPCHSDEGEQEGDDGFLVHYLSVIKNLFQLLFDVLAGQPTSKDGTIGGEEDDVWNSVESIEVVGTILRVEDLWIGNL